MKLPKRNEKGFTLIELLIVVAILGVLAAVVIPNVGRFIGRGETEAGETELSNIQAAVTMMMTDNSLSTLPSGQYDQSATDNMSLFPNPSGTTNVLYSCNVSGTIVNYVQTEITHGTYTVNADGTLFLTASFTIPNGIKVDAEIDGLIKKTEIIDGVPIATEMVGFGRGGETPTLKPGSIIKYDAWRLSD